MSTFSWSLALTLVGLGVLGASSAQEPVNARDGGTLVFVAPADNENSDEGLGCGATFGFSYVIDNVKGSRSGKVEHESADVVLITTFKGAANGSTGKGERQRFKFLQEASPESCTLSFQADGAAEPYKKGSFMNLWEVPDFSPTAVLRDTFKVRYEFSIPSEYPPDSVIANFDRLADKGCNNVGYPRALGFDYENGVGDPVYCVKVGEKVQPVRLGCVPYRNGTICTASAVLQTSREGNRYSAIEGARLLRESVDEIIND